MSERIRELYKRAIVTVPANPGNKEFTWFDPEKFAHLIVQECLEILSKNNPYPPGTTIMYSLIQDEYFDKGWQVAVETKSNQIKKHFGVEE